MLEASISKSDFFPTPRDELEQRLIRRARADDAFRQLLVSDPRAAVEQIVGVALPRRLKVRVVEETPDSLCIVLPVDLSGIGMVAARVATGDHTIGAPGR